MSQPISPPRPETWTSRRLLEWMTGHLGTREVDSPRVVAEMLLSHVLRCDRMRLYMEVDRLATGPERDRLRELVARAARHEPVQYLVGEASFYWRSFAVEPSTLIPQPSTETLVDFVLGRFGTAAGEVRLADIGTGCGCIAISLAAQLPSSRIVATDIVPGALELAAVNAERFKVADRIEFVEGDGTTPLTGTFDAICSNPPYVPGHEHEQMDESVRRHVPPSAWDGGPDGLDVVRPLIATAGALLVPGGWLTVEIADCQRDEAEHLAVEAGFDEVDVLKDSDGLWRVLVGRLEA